MRGQAGTVEEAPSVLAQLFNDAIAYAVIRAAMSLRCRGLRPCAFMQMRKGMVRQSVDADFAAAGAACAKMQLRKPVETGATLAPSSAAAPRVMQLCKRAARGPTRIPCRVPSEGNGFGQQWQGFRLSRLVLPRPALDQSTAGRTVCGTARPLCKYAFAGRCHGLVSEASAPVAPHANMQLHMAEDRPAPGRTPYPAGASSLIGRLHICIFMQAGRLSPESTGPTNRPDPPTDRGCIFMQ